MTATVERSALTTPRRPPVTVAELVAAVRDQQSTKVNWAIAPAAPTMAISVRVLGAHGGAGSSTVALALADELVHEHVNADNGADTPVRLVDRAAPESSGLIAAAEREVASPYAGWRARRRGAVMIYAPDPGPRRSGYGMAPLEGEGHTVVDIGRPWRCARSPRWGEATRTLLVCRATVPGVRRAERVLADLPSGALLAAVGSRRWTGEVEAAFGPRTRALVEGGRCVMFPHNRRIERCGPDSSPLPKDVRAAARRLSALLAHS
jgi:hypothetical protein